MKKKKLKKRKRITRRRKRDIWGMWMNIDWVGDRINQIRRESMRKSGLTENEFPPIETWEIKRVRENEKYRVCIYELWWNKNEDKEWGEVKRIVHLSICRKDLRPVMEFDDLQRIKNELVGEEHEAIQIFPAESRLQDSANQYHLWAFVNGEHIPTGITLSRCVEK